GSRAFGLTPGPMDDIRWFAPNKFCTLVVPRLRERGLSIALDGERPARLALAMDAQVAAAAFAYAARVRCRLIHYVWDLPPWRLGRGRHDWVWHVFGRYLRVPRVGRRYAERPGYYSRLRIVGSGPERPALERLAADRGVACVIDSRLSEDDMVTAYRGAEVVVCPSRFEGFGLTPMEAIACGRPVVVSDIPPHREFLGTAPHFFTVGDDDDLAAAIAAARSGPSPPPDMLRPLRIEAAVDRFSAGLAPYLG